MSRKPNLVGYGILLWFTFLAYSLMSYLIFLRNDFLLERISLLLERPELLSVGRSLARNLHVNSAPTLLFILTITAMFFLYAKALRFVRERPERKAINTILGFALLFLVTTFFSFPALSTDVFDYIASNRVLFVHQANPWLHPPQEFPADEFIYLGSWKFRASVYGPVQFIFSSLIHFLAQDNLVANIVGFKFTGLAFSMGVIYLLKKYLEEFAPERLQYGLLVFSWNPLLHIEIVGNAHNDIVMAFFTVLSFLFFQRKKMRLAGIALAMAVLAKLAALLFLPILVIWLLGRKKRNKAKQFAVWFLTLTLIGLFSLGEGLVGFVKNLGIQLSLYLRSFPTIVRFAFLKSGFAESQAKIAEKIVTIPPFALLYGVVLSKLKLLGVLSGMVLIMTGYLMAFSPMLQPWYLIWVLPFIALLPWGKTQIAALAFTWSSLLYYGVLFVSFYFSPLHFAWQIVMFFVIVLPPLGIWLAPDSWYTQERKGKRK